jgi:hypothetical protein
MDGKKKDPIDPREIDPDAPPSEEELAESARLRDALEDPSKAHEGAELARAVALAHAPRDIGDAEHRAIVARGVAEGSRRVAKKKRGVVIRVTFGVSAVVAIAAGVMFVFGLRGPAQIELAVTRSTQPLFPEKFPQTGGESQRIDRIAMARSSDLRENRFARWGVR